MPERQPPSSKFPCNGIMFGKFRAGIVLSTLLAMLGTVVGCQKPGGNPPVSEGPASTGPASRLPVMAPAATRVSRQGGVPVFTWDPVAGASDYGVLVYASGSRDLLWIWTGAATHARYGALPESLADLEPRTTAPAHTLGPGTAIEWLVIAIDADGRALKVSRRQKLP